ASSYCWPCWPRTRAGSLPASSSWSGSGATSITTTTSSTCTWPTSARRSRPTRLGRATSRRSAASATASAPIPSRDSRRPERRPPGHRWHRRVHVVEGVAPRVAAPTSVVRRGLEEGRPGRRVERREQLVEELVGEVERPPVLAPLPDPPAAPSRRVLGLGVDERLLEPPATLQPVDRHERCHRTHLRPMEPRAPGSLAASGETTEAALGPSGFFQDAAPRRRA